MLALLNLLALALILLAWRTMLWRPRSLPGVARSRPWLLGHRGVRPPPPGESPQGHPFQSVPENSIAALETALDAGLDGIECDVQMTRDGQLVLWHDLEVAQSVVTESDLETLRRLAPALATLDDLPRLAGRYPGTVLNLELKLYRRRGRGIERRLAKALRRAGLQERVIVSSFDPLALARMRLVAPGVRTALLTAMDAPGWLRNGTAAGWLHVDALHAEWTQVDEKLLRWAGARRLPVHAWTVNDAATARRLVSEGVSGIIGDDPETLLLAAGRLGSRRGGDESAGGGGDG